MAGDLSQKYTSFYLDSNEILLEYSNDSVASKCHPSVPTTSDQVRDEEMMKRLEKLHARILALSLASTVENQVSYFWNQVAKDSAL